MTSLKAGGKQVILDVGGERFIAARETLTVFPATRSGTCIAALDFKMIDFLKTWSTDAS